MNTACDGSDRASCVHSSMQAGRLPSCSVLALPLSERYGVLWTYLYSVCCEAARCLSYGGVGLNIKKTAFCSF